ncbi:MAG TPA: hypothetical protein VEL47_02665 [Myxococcota bacterium]|nr:hypothetical protein [Myxococcota bacterium]
MKKDEVRELAEQAYTILDDFESEAAVERALQVLAQAPKDPESYLLMAEIVSEGRHFEQALAWIERGLSHHPKHEGLLLKKASILLDGFEDIDEAFRILISLESSFANIAPAQLKKDLGSNLLLDIYLLLVDCYRLKSDFQQARAHAILARNIEPQDENALLAYATAEFEMGNYSLALSLLEPVDRRTEITDFLWLKAQINCALGQFVQADENFLKANKIDKTRYHRPIRLTDACFQAAFDQALLALPREIREFVQLNMVEILEIIPLELVKDSQGALSPVACITIDKQLDENNNEINVIALIKKNIENLASKKEQIRDLIASAMLHELGKLIVLY